MCVSLCVPFRREREKHLLLPLSLMYVLILWRLTSHTPLILLPYHLLPHLCAIIYDTKIINVCFPVCALSQGEREASVVASITDVCAHLVAPHFSYTVNPPSLSSLTASLRYHLRHEDHQCVFPCVCPFAGRERSICCCLYH